MATFDKTGLHQIAAADVLLQLWHHAHHQDITDRSRMRRASLDAQGSGGPIHRRGSRTDSGNGLVSTPCLPDSEGGETSGDEDGTSGEEGKLTWKQLRSMGWSYIPGSRLGDSLADFFYLPPGVTVENAIKYENAFNTMEQVQSYLTGETVPSSVYSDLLGKRRRDSPTSDHEADMLGFNTPTLKYSRHGKEICGVVSKRGIPCPQRAGSCPYHSSFVYEDEGSEEYYEDQYADQYEDELDTGICGVMSQRGLQCPHRKEVCPYHTDAQRAQARADLRRGKDGPKKSRTARGQGDPDTSDRRWGLGSKQYEPGVELCGVIGARGLPCAVRKGACPYHSVSGATVPPEAELCGVISQRGLPCTHRKHICPYHSENGSRRARDLKKTNSDSSFGGDLSGDEGQVRRKLPEATVPKSPSEIDNPNGEDGKLSWKELRRRGWSYVPGSRLGESLIDFFYLPPGVSVEGAIKYQNAFNSMDQVQAYLAGESLQRTVVQGKRRRDIPSYLSEGSSNPTTPRWRAARQAREGGYARDQDLDDTLSGGSYIHTKKLSTVGDDVCGVVSQRGLRCPHKKSTCPYHYDRKGSRRNSASEPPVAKPRGATFKVEATPLDVTRKESQGSIAQEVVKEEEGKDEVVTKNELPVEGVDENTDPLSPCTVPAEVEALARQKQMLVEEQNDAPLAAGAAVPAVE